MLGEKGEFVMQSIVGPHAVCPSHKILGKMNTIVENTSTKVTV